MADICAITIHMMAGQECTIHVHSHTTLATVKRILLQTDIVQRNLQDPLASISRLSLSVRSTLGQRPLEAPLERPARLFSKGGILLRRLGPLSPPTFYKKIRMPPERIVVLDDNSKTLSRYGIKHGFVMELFIRPEEVVEATFSLLSEASALIFINLDKAVSMLRNVTTIDINMCDTSNLHIYRSIIPLLPKLTHVQRIKIDIDSNTDPKDSVKLLEALQDCHEIQELELYGTSIIRKSVIDPLLSSLCVLPKLITFKLNSYIPASSDNVLVESLSRCNHLTHLAVHNLTSESIQLLAPVMVGYPIVSLDISKSYGVDIEYVTLLLNNCPFLTELNMYNCLHSGRGIASLLSKRRLTTLNIGDNKIDKLEAIELSQYVMETPTITSLTISHNNIGVEGAVALVRALSFCPLTSLDVNFNNIHDVAAIAEFIPGLTSLTALTMSCVNMRTEGAVALVKSLSNCPLTSLDLSSNMIRDSVSGLISGLTSLTSLNMSGCSMGTEGAVSLVKSLSCPITSLSISHNNIGDSVELAKALGNCCGLTRLNLNCNNIGNKGVVAHALKNCSLKLDTD